MAVVVILSIILCFSADDAYDATMMIVGGEWVEVPTARHMHTFTRMYVARIIRNSVYNLRNIKLFCRSASTTIDSTVIQFSLRMKSTCVVFTRCSFHVYMTKSTDDGRGTVRTKNTPRRTYSRERSASADTNLRTHKHEKWILFAIKHADEARVYF